MNKPKFKDRTGYVYRPGATEPEKIRYSDYLKEFHSDETTSPRGVEPRLHIVQNTNGRFEIWSWGVNGNRPLVYNDNHGAGFTKKEAEAALLVAWEFNHLVESSNEPPYFECRKEARQWIREQKVIVNK